MQDRQKKQDQQARDRLYEEKVARFRRAFPPVESPYSKFISFVKKVGSHVVSGFTTFSKLLKKQPKDISNADNKVGQDGKSQSQSNHKGRVLDFNTFVAETLQKENDQEDMQDQEAAYQRKEAFKKQGTIFDFGGFVRVQLAKENQGQDNEIVNQSKSKSQSQNKSLSEQPQSQYSNPRKYVKKDTLYEDDQKLTQAIFRSSKQKARKINQIYNQVMYDRVDTLLQARQIREKEEANRPKPTLDQRYQKYLKTLGVDNKRDGTKGNHQRLCELMKRSKEIVEKKPQRKRVHVEQDLPPIYNIKKVMEVLQMQRKQFFQEKKQKLQQEARQKRQMERLKELEIQRQRKAEQQKRLREQQQLQQIITKENYQKQMQKQLQAEAKKKYNQANRIDQNPEVDLVPSQIQRSRNQLPNGEIQISNSSIQDNSQNNVIVNAVQSYNSPIIHRQQPKQSFSTPPKKVIQGLQQKIDQTLNQIQQNKNVVRQNPFTKPKTTALNINDLINKNPSSLFALKKQTEQPLPTSTVGQAYFSPNQQGPNFFNPNKGQTTVQPQPSYFQNIKSPTKVLPNTIQPMTQNLALNTNNNLFSVSTPFSAVNQIGSSFNPSSINSANPSIFSRPSPELAVHSEPPPSRPFSSLLGNNPEAARMFDHNLFATNLSTPVSLFGPPPQSTANTKQVAARARKGKNPIRIN